MAPPTGAGSEPNLTGGAFATGDGRGQRPVVRAQRVGINVATEGFSKFLGLAERLEARLKGIRDHFAAINKSGREMAGLTSGQNMFTAGGGGGGAGGTGTAGASGGGFGNMVRGFVGVGAIGGGLMIHRQRQQMAESIPIYAQSGLWSSMYSGMDYLNVERQRVAAAGQYAGDRQGLALAQGIGLGYGQTAQQSLTWLAGVSRQVQASGGTMTMSQAAQQGAGFLDPAVMRRQQAMGMRLSREGGQVRDVNQVAMDYIRQYEKSINGGRKLNEFDFINLGTPGSGIRMTFQRLYGLDDSTLDVIQRAGMQNVRAGGNLNFGSAGALSAAGFSNQQMLGLQAIVTQTVGTQRNAQNAARQQDNWIGAMNVEQQIQRTMGALEDATSGATGALIQFERALTVAAGLVGANALMGGLGGGGGGLGMTLLGGRRGAQALAGRAGAAGVAGVAQTAAGVAPAAAGGFAGRGRNTLGRIGMVQMAGAAIGIQQAVNASDWGDVFGAAVGGGVAGSAFGAPGIVAGAALFGGAAAVRSLLGQANEDENNSRSDALQSGFFMTELELISALAGENITGSSAQTQPTSGRSRGLYDTWQIRRGTLIGQYLNTLSDAEVEKLATYIKADPQHSFETLAEARTGFNNMKQFFNDPTRIYKDSEWLKFVRNGSGRTFTFPDFMKILRQHRSALSGPSSRYSEYFGDVSDPFAFTPVNTSANYELLNQLEATTAPMSETGEQTGDGAFSKTGPSKSIFGNQLGDPQTGGGLGGMPSDRTWNGLDPRMKDRLLKLFAASGGTVYLGTGGGTRSEAEQRSMFLSRHVPDPNGDIEWNGQRWRHVKGAAAAPPGRSMHEIGLAADLDGPGVRTWLQQNAGAFGLKTFANVNNEPWHVQLAELPNSRKEYEAGGGGASSQTTAASPASQTTSGPGKVRALSGVNYSVAETLRTATGIGGITSTTTTAGADLGALTPTTPSAGSLTGQQVAQLAYQTGFRGEGLVQLVAISKRESNWNPSAFNGNTGTGDQSYGLMQINMLGSLGPSRRAAYGISTNEQLFDPATNLRAAYILSQGGTDFYHWGGYKGEADTYNTNVAEARQIVQSLGLLGDGSFERVPAAASTGGGGNHNVQFSIVIQSNGDVSYDVAQLTREVRPAMERLAVDIGIKRST